jgi:hypothetical protein
MKIFPLLLVLSSPVCAFDNSDMVACDTLAALAEATMTARQNGASMSDMMRTAMSDQDAPQELVKMMQALVVMAFNQPRYSTAAVKGDTIKDFKNEAYALCYEGLSK